MKDDRSLTERARAFAEREMKSNERLPQGLGAIARADLKDALVRMFVAGAQPC